ncbi:MAG TPA: hypothetical protein VFZ32_13450 [Micromonosporaceae bacterium]
MTREVDRLTRSQREAIIRWKLGHHVFHLMLATMNTRLGEATRALVAGEWTTTRSALVDLARLYDAATSAMRYAADFPRREYEVLVRPSMMPPFASVGFSGVHNTEHAAMLAALRRLRGLYRERQAAVPEPVGAAWRQLLAAQRRNRNNHMFVCRRFVDGGTSLLQEYYAMQRKATEASGDPGGRPSARSCRDRVATTKE